jgi:predicted phosphodiesterase
VALYGVLGDIHGNIEALRAVLDLLASRGAERLLCVGDIVGYNADPDECAALLRAQPMDAIAGNHDLIGTGQLGFERCSSKAAHSLKRTRRLLAPETAAWLRTLPGSLLVEDRIALIHGGVRDVQQYMTAPRHIEENAQYLLAQAPHARVCFFGHSHAQRVYRVGEDGSATDLSGEQHYALDRDALHFVNAGSVDAQRKRDSRLAECALFDSLDWKLEFLTVPYDAASTEAKAAVFGYRISPLGSAAHRVRARIAAAAAWPFSFQWPRPGAAERKPWK